MSLDLRLATPERLGDLLALFGPAGAYSNCWCTWWILSSGAFDTATPDDRRGILVGLVEAGAEPGVLAYRDGEPVGWCALGPRSRYARMMSSRSRAFRPSDDDPDQWVINCFFIRRDERRTGVATALLTYAVDLAFRRGASRVEAYPVDTAERTPGPSDLYTGTLSMFLAAGFGEVSRPNGRPLVRLSRP